MLDPNGPRVVAIGGGHGLSASLRAVRTYASTVTAVVSVADDGGSSGRLRQALPDLPAPGDVRRCLGALADDDAPYSGLLEHRYHDGDLEGHALGNLLLVSLAAELGSFGAAVDELAVRVGAVGRVLPATTIAVDLVADAGSDRVVGQVAVQERGDLRTVAIEPADAPSDPAVAEAIVGADQVVIGPGSLFTSVLAAAVVPAVRSALQETPAQRVFVANLHPQVPETEGFDVADEVAALVAHGIEPDVVLVDPARADDAALARVRLPVRRAPVADPRGAVHAPAPLAEALADLASAAAS